MTINNQQSNMKYPTTFGNVNNTKLNENSGQPLSESGPLPALT